MNGGGGVGRDCLGKHAQALQGKGRSAGRNHHVQHLAWFMFFLFLFLFFAGKGYMDYLHPQREDRCHLSSTMGESLHGYHFFNLHSALFYSCSHDTNNSSSRTNITLHANSPANHLRPEEATMFVDAGRPCDERETITGRAPKESVSSRRRADRAGVY